MDWTQMMAWCEALDRQTEPITPEAFATTMRSLANDAKDNAEYPHVCADELITKVLKQVGYENGATVFENMSRWFA